MLVTFKASNLVWFARWDICLLFLCVVLLHFACLHLKASCNFCATKRIKMTQMMTVFLFLGKLSLYPSINSGRSSRWKRTFQIVSQSWTPALQSQLFKGGSQRQGCEQTTAWDWIFVFISFTSWPKSTQINSNLGLFLPLMSGLTWVHQRFSGECYLN